MLMYGFLPLAFTNINFHGDELESVHVQEMLDMYEITLKLCT